MSKILIGGAIALIIFGLIISSLAFGTSISCLCADIPCNCDDPFLTVKIMSVLPIVAGTALLMLHYVKKL